MIFPPIAVALLLMLAACGAGATVMAALDRRHSLPGGACALFALGLGWGLIGNAALILGLMGAARASAALPLLAVLAAGPWAWRPLAAEARRRLGSWRVSPPSYASVAPAAFVLLGAGLTFVGALTPATEYDVLEYHLAGPLRWLRTGAVGFFPGNIYANMPGQTEMLYMTALAAARRLSPQTAALAPGVAHWMFGLGAGAVLWAIMKRLDTRALARWTVLALFVWHPVVFKIALDAYVDLAVVFWVGLALLAWLEWRNAAGRRGASAPAFVLCWIFLGLAIGAKLTVASLYLLPFAGLMLCSPSTWGAEAGRGRPMALAVLSAGVILALVYLPWAMRAWLGSGNPLFPALSGWLESPHWSAQQTRLWLEYHGQTSPLRSDYWASLVQRLGQPGYWAILPCLVALTSSRRDGRRALALFTLGAYALWALALHSADRFILAAVLSGGAVAAAVLSEEIGRRRWAGVALWVAMALTALPGIAKSASLWLGQAPWQSLAGAAAMREWQARHLQGPRDAAWAARWANAHLSEGDRLLLVYESRFALFDVETAGNTVFDRSALLDALEGAPVRSAADVRAALRRKGFTHVLVNDNDLQLFIVLFTRTAYEKALARGEAVVAEDFHIPFLSDPRYGPLRTPLLQFLAEARHNPATTFAPDAGRVWIAPLQDPS